MIAQNLRLDIYIRENQSAPSLTRAAVHHVVTNPRGKFSTDQRALVLPKTQNKRVLVCRRRNHIFAVQLVVNSGRAHVRRGDGSHQKCDLVFAIGRGTSHLCFWHLFRLYFVFETVHEAPSSSPWGKSSINKLHKLEDELMIYCLSTDSLLNITKSLLTTDFYWLSADSYWMSTDFTDILPITIF